MAFYTDISNYYDKIFPLSKATVDFLTILLVSMKNILMWLVGQDNMPWNQKSKDNLKVIDLDSKMIEKLKIRKATQNL